MAMSKHTPYSVESIYSVKSYCDIPRPPKRTKVFTRKARQVRRVNTEFHEALFSFGRKDRTRRLSDSEFNRQVAAETCYLFDLGCYHIRKAIECAVDLVCNLFCH